ncbi:MAG: PASTA domain-containing protein, partial [Acidimicrobiaceae bacterium]|nr:PASTA domain-containing protein [Acidimicrobiaceae bacterium]
PPVIPPAAGTGFYDGGDTVAETLAPKEEPPRRRRRWPWIVALIVLLLAAGGAAAYVLTRPAKVVVPPVVGEDLNTARTNLQNAGLTLSAPIQVTSPQKAGTVIAQHPLGGTTVREQSTVSLTVSSGPGNTTVPTVVGETLQQAKHALESVNLKVGNVLRRSSTTVADGRVIDTSPTAGTSLPVDTAVAIIVSTGPPHVQVPDVTSEDVGQAKATLQARGFNVTTTSEVSSSVAPGTVIAQDPTGNTSVPTGSTVTLVVAKQSPTVAVPNVVGQTRGAANAMLGAAGFPASSQSRDVTDPNQNGRVISQNPAASTQANRGTTVTIVVGHFVAPTPTTTTPGAAGTPKKKKKKK